MLIGLRNGMAAPKGGSGEYWGLCFTAESANSTVGMSANGSAPSVNLEYSTDASRWSPFTVGSTTVTLANVGDRVWFRAGAGGNSCLGTSSQNYNKFAITGTVAASGNVMSLLDGQRQLTSIQQGYCFFGLFWLCTSLTKAPELPATQLAGSCYDSMFVGCTSLTTAPELPATQLISACYQYMFDGCQNLTAAPVWPGVSAQAEQNSCNSMFRNCTSLTAAPEIPIPAQGSSSNFK